MDEIRAQMEDLRDKKVRLMEEQIKLLGELAIEHASVIGQLRAQKFAFTTMLGALIKASPRPDELRAAIASSWTQLVEQQWPEHEIQQQALAAGSELLAQCGVHPPGAASRH